LGKPPRRELSALFAVLTRFLYWPCWLASWLTFRPPARTRLPGRKMDGKSTGSGRTGKAFGWPRRWSPWSRWSLL